MPDWCNGLARNSTKVEEKVRIFYWVLGEDIKLLMPQWCILRLQH